MTINLDGPTRPQSILRAIFVAKLTLVAKLELTGTMVLATKTMSMVAD